MPPLFGDRYFESAGDDRFLSVPLARYIQLERWKDNQYDTPPPSIIVTPEGLDRAALEACVGGGMSPGIEATWNIKKPTLFSEPFRLKDSGTPGIRPGFLTERLALPWHTDFFACSDEGPQAWWPAARPIHVGDKKWMRNIANGEALIADWTTLGFVIQKGTGYAEAGP